MVTGVQDRRPGTAGEERFGPPRPVRRRVQVPQLAVGVLVTGLCALGFVLLYVSGVQRTAVLSLGVDVVRGEQLELDDLRVVHVGTDDVVGTVAADASDVLVGRTVVADLPAGTLLVEELVTDGAELTAGSGVVGLALPAGRYPSPRLAVGDVVEVVVVDEADLEGQRLATGVEVVGVAPVGSQGLLFVSVLVPSERLGAQVVAAASRDAVHLMQVADRPAEASS
jgi:hypothetical protein